MKKKLVNIRIKSKKIYEKLKKKDPNVKYVIIFVLAILLLGSFVMGLLRGLLISVIISVIYFYNIYGDELMGKNKKTNNKSSSVATQKGKKKRFGRFFRNTIMNVAFLIFGLVVVYFGYIVVNAPTFDPEKLYVKEKSSVYDKDMNLVAELGVEKREKISYNELPEILKDAIIATEDSNFFKHNGVDLGRFAVATVKQVIGKPAGGASTITMQVVKNQFTSKTQSITRKLTDIYLSVFKLEKKYTKEEIMEFYVNLPYLGGGSYGVSQAAASYFGKEVKDLSLPEAAMIAGLFQAPNSYDPFINPDKAEKRRNTVLYLMEKHGYITKDERAIATKVKIVDMLKKVNSNNVVKYQGFIDMVVEEVKEKTGLSPFSTSMEIYSTLDQEKQIHIDKVTSGEIFKFKNDVIQFGVAVTDVNTGAIVAIGSGRNKVGAKTYNFATMIKRQIGSTAKPLFDYGPAIEYNNWSPMHPIKDEPYTYSGGQEIKNFDNKYMGDMIIRDSLPTSRNIPALKVFQQVDNKKIVSFVESLGIKPEKQANGRIHEAHAIGAFNGSNPLQMSAAYAAFANGGYYTKPYTINKIVIKETKETKEFTNDRKQVMSDATAFMISDILNGGVNKGQVGVSKISGVNYAAKTGTSNYDEETKKIYNFPEGTINDLWVVGYDQQYSIGLWYGYEKLDKKYYNTKNHDRNKLFNTIATGIFEKTGKTFEAPASVVKLTVEKGTYPYKLASDYTPDDMKITDYFKVGSEPTDVSNKYMKIPNVSNSSIKYSNSKIIISWDTPIYVESMGIPTYNIYSNNVKIGSTDKNTYTIDSTENKNYTFTIKAVFSNYSGESSGVNVSIDLSSTGSEPVISLVGDQNILLAINDVYVEQGIKVMSGSNNVTSDATVIKTITGSGSSISTSQVGQYTITYAVTYINSGKTYTKTLTRNVVVQ